ncbi:(E)-beta-farnesene synthase-like protein, partial [Tanacetum coccineum]
LKEYTRSLLVEAKWVKEGYTPTLKEYMSNSLLTSAYPLMLALSYVGRDRDIFTEDSFEWVASYPPHVKALASIIRLMDDIVTHEKEQERGHVASCIECYQKETGASKKEACEVFSKQVEDAWKVINRESLRPTHVPSPLVIPIINFARVADATYRVNDGLSYAGKEAISYMKSILLHPIVV